MTAMQEILSKRGDEQQIVVFSLGAEEFGVDINDVKEIIKWEQVTRIPNTADHVLGVINLRGNIVVVMDLAKRLSLPAKVPDKNTRIIILEKNNMAVGVVVDSATEVLRLPMSQLQPAPKIITERISHKYIKAVGILGQRLLILLDITNLFTTKEVEDAKAMT